MPKPPLASYRARKTPCVLLVDDDPTILRGLHRVISKAFPTFVVLTAQSGTQALGHLKNHTVDVVLTDLYMPNMDGESLLEIVKTRYPKTVRVIHSSQYETLDKARLERLCDRALPKPANAAELEEVLAWALEGRNGGDNPGQPAAG